MVHSDENKSIVCEYINKEHNNDYNGDKRQTEVDKFVRAVTSIDYLKKQLSIDPVDFYSQKPFKRWGKKWP